MNIAAIITVGQLTSAPALLQPRPPEPTPCPSSPGVFRGGPLPEPRKLVHVNPVFPQRRQRTRIGTTLWIGEAQIGVDGKVLSVEVLRRVSLDPPWPEWEEAIPAAVRQWRFSPACLLGKPQKVFMTIMFDPIVGQFRSREPRSEPSMPPARRPPSNEMKPTSPGQHGGSRLISVFGGRWSVGAGRT
jgi:hypothetical protein